MGRLGLKSQGFAPRLSVPFEVSGGFGLWLRDVLGSDLSARNERPEKAYPESPIPLN